ncbi:hypothetical protein ACFU96_47495 [Streptomyces sp. NPDC057620]
MTGIYDDGATYGIDPDAEIPDAAPADPIYDDGAAYGTACPLHRTVAAEQ